MPFYAVVAGRNPGIYSTWDDCKEQTAQYPGAWYKKFKTRYEASLCMKSKELFKHLRVSKKYPNGHDDTSTQLVEEVEQTFTVNTNEWLNAPSEMKSIKKDANGIRSSAKRDNIGSDNGAVISGPRQSSPFSPGQAPFKSDKGYLPPLIEDSNGYIDVYIDGAVDRNWDIQNAKGGVGVWFNHDHPLNIAAPLEGTPTTINAEIQAATRAIQQAAAAGLTKLNIHTDSLFMINCFTKSTNKWKNNEINCEDPTKNTVELEKLEEAIKNMEAVTWTHTRSHQGIEGNEYADSLAHAGILLNGFQEFKNYPSPEE